jgi:hypothetical protein
LWSIAGLSAVMFKWCLAQSLRIIAANLCV